MEGLVKRMMDCVGKDQIGLYYRSGGCYRLGSVLAMELCDEIQRLQIVRNLDIYGECLGSNDIDRSSIVVAALSEYRNHLVSMIENAEFIRGEL